MNPSNTPSSADGGLIKTFRDILGIGHRAIGVEHLHTLLEVEGLNTALDGKLPFDTVVEHTIVLGNTPSVSNMSTELDYGKKIIKVRYEYNSESYISDYASLNVFYNHTINHTPVQDIPTNTINQRVVFVDRNNNVNILIRSRLVNATGATWTNWSLKVLPIDVYSKTESDTLLEGKASLVHTHESISRGNGYIGLGSTGIAVISTKAFDLIFADGDFSGELVIDSTNYGYLSRVFACSIPISDIVGLQTALDGKALSVHSHTMSEVTGLVNGLEAKEDLGNKIDNWEQLDTYTPEQYPSARMVRSSLRKKLSNTLHIESDPTSSIDLDDVVFGETYLIDNSSGRSLSELLVSTSEKPINFHQGYAGQEAKIIIFRAYLYNNQYFVEIAGLYDPL